MFDDFFNATVLVGLIGVASAVVLSAPAGPTSDAEPAPLTIAAADPPVAMPDSAAPGTIPIPVLPRGVVTGQRLRDADVVATGSGPTTASPVRQGDPSVATVR